MGIAELLSWFCTHAKISLPVFIFEVEIIIYLKLLAVSLKCIRNKQTTNSQNGHLYKYIFLKQTQNKQSSNINLDIHFVVSLWF